MVLNSFTDALKAAEEKWPHDWQNDIVYLNNAGEAELSKAVSWIMYSFNIRNTQ